jgi:hypothetical protein
MGKTTAQGYREEGAPEGMRKMVLRLGRSNFGDPDETIERAIRSIDKAERLDAIADRILIANNWNELLKN